MTATNAISPDGVARWVADACTELGLPVRSPSDDFFALGGTSLSVIRLVARAEEEFGEDCLPPDQLYERSTVQGIADLITRNIRSIVEDTGG